MGKHDFEKMNDFFNRVKNVGFFERLFSWKSIQNLSYDAYAEFESTNKIIEDANEDIAKKEGRIKELESDAKHTQKEITRLEGEIVVFKEKISDVQKKHEDDKIILAKLEQEKATKDKEYQKNVQSVNDLKIMLEGDRLKVQQERETEITERFEKLKDTWRHHENKVESAIMSICERTGIEYCGKEKVPFKGKPDNAIKILDEYIIFDAKSPASDDLDNFPSYIKQQAESAKKYIKEQDVKKDIFLVIPSNTVDKFDTFYYNLADYNVYIVTIDALEPIMLSLKNIENYEFADKLSPEDRDHICRVIGKFAHATKRRIQVDGYFNNEVINILSSCNNLPEDIKDKMVEFEKSDKMNPPIEKRTKLISDSELKKDIKLISQEAELKGIDTDADFDVIEQVPLHKKKKN